jgi:hypothetical protein
MSTLVSHDNDSPPSRSGEPNGNKEKKFPTLVLIPTVRQRLVETIYLRYLCDNMGILDSHGRHEPAFILTT